MDNLTDRLDRLERSNRHLKGAVALLSLAFAALVAVGWTSPDGTVEATKFVLRDTDGQERAVLHVREIVGQGDSPTLEMSSADGKSLMFLGIDPNGPPALRFLDGNEKLRTAVGVLPSGSPYLTLRDADGKLRVAEGVDVDGSPSLTLFDSNGKIRVAEGVDVNGLPSVTLLDANGKIIWQAP